MFGSAKAPNGIPNTKIIRAGIRLHFIEVLGELTGTDMH